MEKTLTDEGYDQGCYFHWQLYSDGSIEITNNETNYVMKQYLEDEILNKWIWDREREYYTGEDGKVRWKHTGATVSGNGIQLIGRTGKNNIANSGKNVNIYGGAGNDSISNGGMYANIDGGAGNDLIRNSGMYASIDGGEDNDHIVNYTNEVTINGGNGDDYIYNSSSICNVTIYGGLGNDSIRSAASKNITIYGGDGDDYISNEWKASCFMIDGGVGNDTIINFANTVTIYGGEGDDEITNHNYGVKIYGDEGDDTIYSHSNAVTIEGGSGNDSIRNNAHYVSINAGDGQNTVESDGNKVKIKSSGNNSSINSNASINSNNSSFIAFAECSIDNGEILGKKILGSGTTIQAGIAEDFINNVANAVSINAGGGKNTITNGFYDNSLENMVKFFAEGQDNFVDLIMEFTGNSTQYTRGGESVTVISGGGEDVIMNFGSYSSIHSGKGEDRIFSADGEYNIINGGDDNDQISVYHDNKSLIIGGEGNDEIIVSRLGAKEYIEATKFVATTTANELILNNAKKYIGDVILGTISKRLIGKLIPFAGNILTVVDFFRTRQNLIDEFSLESEIVGGKGNDFVACDALAPRIYYYSNGDGNDTISGFSNAQLAEYLSENLVADMPISTLYIESGNIESVTVNDSDVILKMGEGSITLEDGVNQKFNLKESDGTLTTRAYGKDGTTGELICSIWGAAADEVIKDTINAENTHYVLYGYRIANENSEVEFGKDELHGNAKSDIIYGEMEDSLYGYGGNDLLYGKNKCLMDGGDGNDIIYSGKETEFNQLHPTVPAYGNKNKVYGGKGNDIIYNYGSETFIDGGADDDQIYNYGANFMAEGGHFVGGNKVTINGGAGNDVINLYLDKNSTAIETFITYSNGDDNDTIYGFNKTSTLKVIGAKYSTVKSGNDVIVKVGDGSITLKDAALLNTINIDGQKIGETTPAYPAGLSIEGNKLLLSKEFEETTLNVNDFSEPISIVDATEMLYGIKIFGNSSINLFNGSNYGDVYYCEYPTASNAKVSGRVLESSAADNVTANSTINAAGGDDTLYGNGNKILYQYAAGDGNDIIYGFTYKDTLQISGGDFTSIESGDDVILTVGDGSITLKDAKNISLHIDGNYSGVTNLSVVGTKQADTLIDGAGDDIFTGGSGKDVFVYSGGNDTITDYAAGQDKISLSGGKVNNSKLENKDVILYTDEGSITVKNGKNKKITVTDGDGNTTIETFGRITYNEDKTEIALSSIFTGNLNAADYDSSIVKIDATEVAKAVKIFGNDNDNTITGGKGNDTLSGGAGSDTFIYTAGNDVIADFEVGKDTLKLANGTVSNYSISGKDAVLKVGSKKITLKNVGTEKFTVIDVDNIETVYGLDAGLKFNKGDFSAATAVTISADYESESFDATAYSKVVTIDAANNNKAIGITGNAKNNKIIGTAGDDTLSGGNGNDTLIGGAGSDTFIYTAGNDVITDFEIGKDTLKLSSGTVSNYSISGKDAVLKVGSKKITLKNIGTEKFTVIGADNTETVYGLDAGLKFNKGDFKAATAVTIYSDYESESFDATAYSKVVTINAANNNKAIGITGNAKNNKIIGTTGDDTLFGDTGNDTLTGGNGADTFIYTAGKDVITDYTAGEDVIKLKGNLTVNYSTKKNDTVLKIGSGTLTLKNAANAEITVVDSSGYTSIFGAATDKFLTSNNFISQNTIDEIMESNYTITNFTQEDKDFILQDETQTYISEN